MRAQWSLTRYLRERQDKWQSPNEFALKFSVEIISLADIVTQPIRS